jgi:glycosyltransferase involved in cell wall biosynthesis
MPRISFLLPTRGRPQLLRRLFDSLAMHTSSLEDLEIILYLDDDDETGQEISDDRFSLIKIIGPRLSMGAYNTICLGRASGDFIMLMNDDVIVRTSAWDRRVVELGRTISDGIFLAYPNDLHIGKRMCTFPILTRKACELLLRPYPEEYKTYFIDWHVFDTFKRLHASGHHRILYLEEVVFEHCHYMAGKAELDATYKAKDYYQDDWTFLNLRPLRQQMAERLAAAIAGRPIPELQVLPAPALRPDKTSTVLLRYISDCLGDPVLPMEERVRLFIWLTGRYLRHQKYLPTKKPSRKAIQELRILL